jgi:hypothetical protein
MITRCFSIICHNSCLDLDVDFWVSFVVVSIVEQDENEHNEDDEVVLEGAEGIIIEILVYLIKGKKRKRKKKKKK